MNEWPQRKPNRLQGYDYSQNGAYFVTLCVQGRHEWLGSMERDPVGATALGRPRIQLTEIGKCLEETIRVANKGDVTIPDYVIMPNHVHMIVVISSETGDRGRSPLHQIVRNIKSFVAKQIGFPIWQKSFHDRILRNEQEYLRIAEYIKNNPANWQQDCFYPANN